jgi:hypothetical protein
MGAKIVFHTCFTPSNPTVKKNLGIGWLRTEVKVK